MRKSYKLVDLDCAHCAAKMEEAVKKLPGVKSATVNFMALKMVIEADEADMDSVCKAAVAACKKIEPDCEIVAK